MGKFIDRKMKGFCVMELQHSRHLPGGVRKWGDQSAFGSIQYEPAVFRGSIYKFLGSF